MNSVHHRHGIWVLGGNETYSPSSHWFDAQATENSQWALDHFTRFMRSVILDLFSLLSVVRQWWQTEYISLITANTHLRSQTSRSRTGFLLGLFTGVYDMHHQAPHPPPFSLLSKYGLISPCNCLNYWCIWHWFLSLQVSHHISSHLILSHPIPSHPIPSLPSHPIPSYPIPSHLIPSHPPHLTIRFYSVNVYTFIMIIGTPHGF